MFDARLRQRIDPALNRLAAVIAKTGLSANALTGMGAVTGIVAGMAIATQYYTLALFLVIINRIVDGLDGAVARIKGSTFWGGYLDTIADYIFYVAVPVGFSHADTANQVPALVLVASFTLTAVSFLGFAAIAAKQGLDDEPHGPKAFLYSTGLMEGGETIAFFMLMCAFPAYFATLAMLFAGLCILTVGQRIWIARQRFR
jgi:phosphatidylglycerophosphate synthase